MQTLKKYLINKGFTEIESTIYIKDIEVVADKRLTVKVHTFKPHKTIWIKVINDFISEIFMSSIYEKSW